MSSRGFAGPSKAGRWATPYHGGIAVTSQTFTVGRVLLVMFDLLVPRLIDGITYIVGTTSNGNVRVGIVGPIPPATDTAAAFPVLVQSASVAQGPTSGAQFVALTPTMAPAGVYYAALQGDSATGTYMRQTNATQAAGLNQYYDRAGGYGEMISPTPATTDTGSAAPGLRIRLA